MKINNLILIFLVFLNLQKFLQAEDENSFIEINNTNCDILVDVDENYQLTYEEKVEIASNKFDSTINKNEQACDPRFQTVINNVSSSSSSGSSGGGISGSQSLDSEDLSELSSASVSTNSSLEEEDNGASSGSDGQANILTNGKLPECIRNISGDDEIARQMKESIAIVSDEEQKNALIQAYSDYKGLNIDPEEC